MPFKHYYALSWIVICLALPGRTLAQIKGKVTDADTGNPISLVNVYYVNGKAVGTATNTRGRYTLSAPVQSDTLVFSCMGFKPFKVPVKAGARQTINVCMQDLEQELSEVQVKPRKQKYRRKNNPAVELMRKVIAAKEGNRLEQNDYCRFSRYQRITLAFNNITQASVDSGFLHRYPSLSRRVEYCPQTGTRILPVTYTETASEHVYRKEPEAKRDFVRATHSEGVNDLFAMGEISNVVLQSYFTDVNIYDNSIRLLERQFTSPLSASNAITFYQYFIMDTLEVKGDRCIELSYVPQNPQDFGFSGRLWILDDGTYRVKRCLVSLPMRSAVNFINNLIIEQDFGTLPNGQHVLLKDNMTAEMGALKKYHNLLVKRVTTYSNFRFDSVPDAEFERKETLREGNYSTGDGRFWAENRTDTLTSSEEKLATLVTEMSQAKGFGWLLWLVRALVENYVETSPPTKKNYVDFGPINTLVSSNFVDKVRFRASAQTTANLNPHLFLKGYVAYGIRDHRWKYLGQVEYSFLRKQYSPEEFPRNSITLSARYDVMAPADALLPTDKDNVFVSMKTQTVDQMSYVRTYSLRYRYDFDNHFGIIAQLRHSTQSPTGMLFYRTLSGYDVTQLRQSEATLSFRFAPGEILLTTKQRQRPVGRNHPVYTLMHTTGFKGVLGGDYVSNYTELSVGRRFWFNSYGFLDTYICAGAQWNRVPFPLLIMPAANTSYIIHNHMFNMLNNMEFMNDRFVSLDLQWDMSGKLFNRIPLLRHLKWREVLGFKALYGTLTHKNNPDFHPGSGYLYEFPSRKGVSTSHAMGNTPYMELNAGIHNIFKIIRIDYVRRLNYLHLPGVKKNGVRFVLQFNF